jgi:glutamate-1-semialdehyde 2,1-aminomutase
MFGTFFNDHPVRNYAEVKQSDAQRYATFFHKILAHGVYFAPSAFEAAFSALPHEGEALVQTVAALKEVIPQL